MLVVIENHTGITPAQAAAFVSGTTNTLYCPNPDPDCVSVYPAASGCGWFVNAHAGITSGTFVQGLADQYVFVDWAIGIVYFPPSDFGR